MVYIVLIVIGDVLIFIMFIAVGEMLYKVIFGELWLVRARLVMKRTVMG